MSRIYYILRSRQKIVTWAPKSEGIAPLGWRPLEASFDWQQTSQPRSHRRFLETKNKNEREKKRGKRGADGEGREGKKQRRATGANLVKGEMTKGREEDEERERDSERESKAREGRRKEGEGVEGDEGAAKEEMKDVVRGSRCLRTQ